MRYVIIIGSAFLLDLIFGDPYFLPHPVCLIGNTISFLETQIRKWLMAEGNALTASKAGDCEIPENMRRNRDKNEFLGGALLVITVLALSFILPFALLYAAGRISPYLALLMEIYFCYQIFAVKSLRKESMKVYYPLLKKDMAQARKYLSYIVGRDTQKLDEKGVIKAAVETVAENTTDGVIAPLLFMAVGGAPLAFLYKAINTMDSMIGYKNEKYIRFGRCAARLDDAANFLPARLSAFLMILAAAGLRLDFRNAVKIYARDRRNHKSPNSAQTESVCAGALNIQLAGDASYFGQLVHKPTIGDAVREVEPKDIVITNRLMYLTSVLAVLLVIAVRGLLWRLI